MDTRGQRALICVLVVAGCLVVFVPFASAAVGNGFGAGSVAAQENANGTDQVDGGGNATTQETAAESHLLDDADEIHIEVAIQENGSATFTVDYRFDNGSEEWAILSEDVEANPEAYAAAEAADWNETLEAGMNETDREMELSNVSVTTETSTTPVDLGHVEFSFRWSSFAYVHLNRMEVGDALVGFTLVDDTTLQLSWPDRYTVQEVDPAPSNPPDGSVFWEGDNTEFAEEQPRLVLIENGGTSVETTETEDDPTLAWLVVASALGGLAALGVVGWWLRRDGATRRPPETAADGTTTADHAVTDGDHDGPPPELLSNEERVLQLLERKGGRIKQQEVVSELEWTEAKTSQVVSNLREDDEIDVFRIGRENVLTLAGEDDEDD
ncbi:helix-turn-helix transcriptional regulator [Halopiger goleimassiliensis]|uniref:helix-turn-helix transcriptional regulator n=1 Tax=Halopiger goleimassiliensis TaxID=1293048 RepID=UPI0006777B08|nr:DUF4897 domain-containing protein [Halopiger goleimassiliensis]